MRISFRSYSTPVLICEIFCIDWLFHKLTSKQYIKLFNFSIKGTFTCNKHCCIQIIFCLFLPFISVLFFTRNTLVTLHTIIELTKAKWRHSSATIDVFAIISSSVKAANLCSKLLCILLLQQPGPILHYNCRWRANTNNIRLITFPN